MALYAIGDVQGCYDDLMRLLDQIDFRPERDKLWFAGDLVNRGPDSLRVLRFIKQLGKRAVTVLGNHDLHLLAISEGNIKHKSADHTLDDILRAPDREELLHWLRTRPLMHYSKKRDICLIHAGLPPQWDIPTAREMASEVEQALSGEGYHDLCMQMYGNRPDLWSEDLAGIDRLRFIINCFTRLRYCLPEGRLALREKGPPGTQRPPAIPWFEVPARKSRDCRILFGHWSTLGYRVSDNIWSLDTGCLWGRKLTALRIKKRDPAYHQSVRCPGIPR